MHKLSSSALSLSHTKSNMNGTHQLLQTQTTAHLETRGSFPAVVSEALLRFSCFYSDAQKNYKDSGWSKYMHHSERYFCIDIETQQEILKKKSAFKYDIFQVQLHSSFSSLEVHLS